MDVGSLPDAELWARICDRVATAAGQRDIAESLRKLKAVSRRGNTLTVAYDDEGGSEIAARMAGDKALQALVEGQFRQLWATPPPASPASAGSRNSPATGKAAPGLHARIPAQGRTEPFCKRRLRPFQRNHHRQPRLSPHEHCETDEAGPADAGRHGQSPGRSRAAGKNRPVRGGGAVTVTALGNGTLKSVVIAKDLLAAGDADMLQDMILVAANNALEAVKKEAESRMSGVTAGLQMPGLF